MPDETTINTATNASNSPGQPIAKSTGELMMSLYQARIRSVSELNPGLGVKFANEPKQLFFNLANINALLQALNGTTQHVATCLGLTVLDPLGNPVAPTAEQVLIMHELVELLAAGNYEAYKLKLQTISLGQTILIAGCDDKGNLIVNETGVYSFYDMAGYCCRD
jgi:hypothetical protein